MASKDEIPGGWFSLMKAVYAGDVGACGPYVLVTAAYNEEKYIRDTIMSILSQTCRPKKWVIVSDGSTDRTDKIVQEYADQCGLMIYARQEKRSGDSARLERVSIAQARAMALALELLQDIEYDFFGNLDADITLEPAYYEKVINKLIENHSLGICGGGVYSVNDDGGTTGEGFLNPEFVGGPVQLFRRKCLQEIGGYKPYGHTDCVAVATAKMSGWNVRCFPGIQAFHHGMPANTVREKVPVCFRMGKMDYIMGGLLVFELARCVRRSFRRPFLVAGMAMLAGYAWEGVTAKKSCVPKDLVKFMQVEQMEKLRSRLPFFLSAHAHYETAGGK